jgi:hypothetical protein
MPMAPGKSRKGAVSEMPDYVYRRYVYIDTDEVMAHATVMDGGEISDEVRTITRQRGGKIGAELGPKLIPFNLSIAANASRSIKQQFKIRQTAYVATDKVIKNIKKDKVLQERGIREGMVIECDVFLERLRTVPDDQQVKPDSWVARRQEERDPRIKWARLYANRQDMAVEALSIRREVDNSVVILALSPQWLLRPDEFSRCATIVGKVVGVKREGEMAEDAHDGTLDFRRQATSKSQEVAQSGGDSQAGGDSEGQDSGDPDNGGPWWRRRKPSRHARDVADARKRAQPAQQERGAAGPQPAQATIRLVPIAIYK